MAKKFKKKILSFSVIYEAVSEGGWVVWVPFLPGCHTQGETLEEAEKNVKEAISVYLESLISHRESFPREERILQGKVEVEI